MLAKRNLSDALITMTGVGIKRLDSWLICDIDLTVKAHDVIAIIGANGSGKSTLIKALLGLIPPTQGTITKAKGVHLGYVPQKFVIPKTLPLTVADLLAQSLQRLPKAKQATLYTLLNISPLLKKQVATLSGGETQRVLLARALLDKPTVLVLDEPAQGLDPDAQRLLYDLLATLPQRLGCALLVVSHDLTWVMQTSQHVICLDKHICCQGDPKSVLSSPKFSAIFANHLPTKTPSDTRI